MPASEVAEVFEQSFLDLIKSLSLLLHGVHVESLHGECLGVVRVLFQNQFSILEGLLELLVIVQGQHLSKEVLLLLLEAVSG